MRLKNFFTQIEPIDYPTKVHHTDDIISVGSCFSTEIGNRLKDLEFNILVNPFGTIFNPISIFNLITSSIYNTPIQDDQIVNLNGLYYHYQWHSSVYGTSKDELISKIQSIQLNVQEKLKSCNHLILTFGTAIVHDFNHSVVANCHKQDKHLFTRRFLNLEELIHEFENFNKIITEYNPSIQIITTTSPIRHTKEGLVDNNQSKALLNVFNGHLNRSYTHLHYFPSYEIIMDVLRDYRFFKEDLIHPTQQAVDEIWTYFHSNLVNPKSTPYILKMEKYLQMKAHKIMFPESEEGRRFTEKKLKLYNEIQQLKVKP